MSRPAEARRLISYEYGAVHGPRVRLGDCRLTVPEEMPRRSAARGYVDVFDSRDQEADQ
ncbi:hypothetical protein ABZT04_14980 [Streptomyces sp. NPDC005492]|uniref:hypothetical protein n=1 Tax=Streptomyces sp. NPDC005492 TaxID=3156883 RepID=UPI0033A95BF9